MGIEHRRQHRTEVEQFTVRRRTKSRTAKKLSRTVGGLEQESYEECRRPFVKIEDWVTKSRMMKWSWAGHVARRTDGRWSTAVLEWKPIGGKRNVGRPIKRWGDDLID